MLFHCFLSILLVVVVNADTYPPYFEAMNNALKGPNGKGESLMLVDLDMLDHNIQQLTSFVPRDKIRLVTKSVPSLDLIDYLLKKVGTKRVMVFSVSMLTSLLERYKNNLDILWGEPLLAQGLDRFLQKNISQDLLNSVQWLVDTPERLQKYLKLAEQFQVQLTLNFEIDVGLHRGGTQNTTVMQTMLNMLHKQSKVAQFSGFMGYDGHVAFDPLISVFGESAYWKALENVIDNYNGYKNALRETNMAWSPNWIKENITFNGAGSNTIAAYKNISLDCLNDYATGSAFLLPADFSSQFTLLTLRPALYSASPILKDLDGRLPIPYLTDTLWKDFRVLDKDVCKSYYLQGLPVGATIGKSAAPITHPDPILSTFSSSEAAVVNLYPTQTLAHVECVVSATVGDYVITQPKEADAMLQFDRLFIYFGSNQTLSTSFFSVFRAGL